MAKKRARKQRDREDGVPPVRTKAAEYRERMEADPESVPGILNQRANNVFRCDLRNQDVVDDLDLVCLIGPVEAAVSRTGGPLIPLAALSLFDRDLGRRAGKRPRRK